MENELWIEPPDSLLEAINRFLSANQNSWSGTPTALAEALDLELKANVVTLRLNISAGRLLKEYGIWYRSSRSHDGRKIALSRVEMRTA